MDLPAQTNFLVKSIPYGPINQFMRMLTHVAKEVKFHFRSLMSA